MREPTRTGFPIIRTCCVRPRLRGGDEEPRFAPESKSPASAATNTAAITPWKPQTGRSRHGMSSSPSVRFSADHPGCSRAIPASVHQIDAALQTLNGCRQAGACRGQRQFRLPDRGRTAAPRPTRVSRDQPTQPRAPALSWSGCYLVVRDSGPLRCAHRHLSRQKVSADRNPDRHRRWLRSRSASLGQRGRSVAGARAHPDGTLALADDAADILAAADKSYAGFIDAADALVATPGMFRP